MAAPAERRHLLDLMGGAPQQPSLRNPSNPLVKFALLAVVAASHRTCQGWMWRNYCQLLSVLRLRLGYSALRLSSANHRLLRTFDVAWIERHKVWRASRHRAKNRLHKKRCAKHTSFYVLGCARWWPIAHLHTA